jgi:hypothetical protein
MSVKAVTTLFIFILETSILLSHVLHVWLRPVMDLWNVNRFFSVYTCFYLQSEEDKQLQEELNMLVERLQVGIKLTVLHEDG